MLEATITIIVINSSITSPSFNQQCSFEWSTFLQIQVQLILVEWPAKYVSI